MIDHLEPAGPSIVLRCSTRSPVDSDREPETDFSHVHLMVPRVACIRPLDEPRVKCQPHPRWNVTGSDIVLAFTRQVPRSKILLSTRQDRATLVLDDGIRMKFEESILQIIPIPSQYGAAYSVHYLSPSRETRSPAFLLAGATGSAGRHRRLVWGGGDGGPLRAHSIRLGWHLPQGLEVGKETASPTPSAPSIS